MSTIVVVLTQEGAPGMRNLVTIQNVYDVRVTEQGYLTLQQLTPAAQRAITYGFAPGAWAYWYRTQEPAP